MWTLIKLFIRCHFLKFLSDGASGIGTLCQYIRHVDNEMKDEPSWVEGKHQTIKLFIICTLLVSVLAWLCQ